MTVYLIQNPTERAVKIGYTDTDPLERLRSLQTGSVSKLRLVATIPDAPMSVEKHLHAQFRHLSVRLGGEWFVDDPMIRRAFVDHKASHHRRHLEERIQQALSDLTDVLTRGSLIRELETALETAKSVLDARACGCGSAQVEERADPVTEFWHEHEAQFAWDLLPFKFLYGCFSAWFRAADPFAVVVSQRSFTDSILPLVQSSAMWQCDKRDKQVHTGSKMRAPELLIYRYDLRDWMNQNYSGNDIYKITRFSHPALQYRGLQRIPGAPRPTPRLPSSLTAAVGPTQ